MSGMMLLTLGPEMVLSKVNVPGEGFAFAEDTTIALTESATKTLLGPVGVMFQ